MWWLTYHLHVRTATNTNITAPPVNRPYRHPIPIIDRISSSFPVAAGDEIVSQTLDAADRQQPQQYRIVRFRTPFVSLFRSRSSASTAIAAAAAATVAASGNHLAGRERPLESCIQHENKRIQTNPRPPKKIKKSARN
uniref:Uncharacterized protein n=1 Tax=Anopheles maculatus TaxID=74869 RepID=A0A182SB53_9DIPT